MTPSTPPLPALRAERPAAVLFDLDGTLVDSERLWLDVIRERMAGIRRPLSSEHLGGFEGLSSIEAARRLIELGEPSTSETGLAAELEGRTIASFAGRLSWIAGADTALGALREAGIPLALVTSSTERWVAAVAESIPLGSFDVVVTADDVRHTKPHPEPYLRATALLAVTPADCVVFEDSAVGVEAALAAGCRVVQVRAEAGDAASAPLTRIPDLRRVTAKWVGSLPARASRSALPEPALH
ncbi:HAD family hydrolase [Microbacterium sp. NPDC057944]|uniref:HAD family hydrolase n=1 Tax=Microbacterium sp. NPDC057944 TaxID=3346286 RepID=UPI0036D92E87